RVGDGVNLETDTIAKYVARLLAAGGAWGGLGEGSAAGEGPGGSPASGGGAHPATITESFLAEHGF
ncbi:hypothetical protein, partial [Bifidobacterium catulorum]|uniref:hypothetical protein n=1 Tax=Bifidobacterium catulorum TaxID=1630173 RepID=UPI0019D4E897